MSTDLRLRIRNRIEDLPEVSEAVEELGRAERWPQDICYAVVLALEEMATNVVRHGGGEEGDSEIEIDVVSASDEIRLEIRDECTPFDPFSEGPEPDVNASLGERNIGGLGIHFVRVLMDEMSYRRENDRNHTIMVKRR